MIVYVRIVIELVCVGDPRKTRQCLEPIGSQSYRALLCCLFV